MDPMKQFDAMKQGFSSLAERNKDSIDMSEYEEFTPPDDIPFAHISEDGRVQGQMHEAPQYEMPSYEERPQRIGPNDEEFFDDGPLISEVESWKKQYDGVYLVDDLPGDMIYIYRTLNRYEY